MNAIRTAWEHIKACFHQKFTYGAIVGAIAGGAGLAYPFNWLAVVFGVAGVLIPTP